MTPDHTKLIAELRAAVPLLVQYVQWHGGDHEDDCPGDDTCDCAHKPVNDAANLVCHALPSLLDALEAVTKERDELREQRNDVAESNEKCHKMLDAYYGIADGTTSMDTLENRVEKMLEQVRKGWFNESRSQLTGRLPKAYTDEELVTMFEPWWKDRSVEGLSPREVRLLETVVDRNLRIRQMQDDKALTCVYCGHEYPFNNASAEQLHEHIKVCEKHPLSKAIAERDALAAKLKQAEEALRRSAQSHESMQIMCETPAFVTESGWMAAAAQCRKYAAEARATLAAIRGENT